MLRVFRIDNATPSLYPECPLNSAHFVIGACQLSLRCACTDMQLSLQIGAGQQTLSKYHLARTGPTFLRPPLANQQVLGPVVDNEQTSAFSYQRQKFRPSTPRQCWVLGPSPQ